MKFCPQCGEPGADIQKFCIKCGADTSGSPVAAMPYYPPQAKAKSNTGVIVLVVVAAVLVLMIPVVLIVAAIAIPNLLRARIAANESSAAASVRTIVTAAIQYQSQYGHYPEILQQLSEPPAGTAPDQNHAGLIDATLASRSKNGYEFTYRTVGYLDDQGKSKRDGFTINADPIQPGRTGNRYFFCNEEGVVRVETGQQASDESPPIQ